MRRDFRTPLAALLTSSALSLASAADAPTAVERGALLYQARCAACHAVDFHGIGPAHRGVFGRPAATAKGYGAYSLALQRSGLVWTEANLDRWLADPEALVPGQAMGVTLPDAAERADVIAFLRSLAARKE